MQRIAKGIRGHDAVLDVCLNDLQDGSVNGYSGQRRDEFEATVPRGKVSALEFIDYSKTGDEFGIRARLGPPVAGPDSARDHLRLGPRFKVEAGNGRFDVGPGGHTPQSTALERFQPAARIFRMKRAKSAQLRSAASGKPGGV
jgi:hypothetical protein